MVLFGRAYELRATPLSSAVPLEGTDTIPGLRILEQTVPASFQRNCFERVRRYRGPYLQQLTTDHLKAEPKPWRTFFEGTEGWSGSYCIPSDWFSLTDRAEENVVLFLPNYLRVALVCFAVAMYMAPLGALGLALMFLIWDFARTYTERRQLDDESWEYKAVHVGAQVAMWAVALKSRGVVVLSKGALAAAALIAAHASLKVAPSERRRGRAGLARLFARGHHEPPRPQDSLRNLCSLLGVDRAWSWLAWQWAELRWATEALWRGAGLGRPAVT